MTTHKESFQSVADAWRAENEAYPVGQTADLHTKKKGKSTPKDSPLRDQLRQLQAQQASALARECELIALLKECRAKFACISTTCTDETLSKSAWEMLEKLGGVLDGYPS